VLWRSWEREKASQARALQQVLFRQVRRAVLASLGAPPRHSAKKLVLIEDCSRCRSIDIAIGALRDNVEGGYHGTAHASEHCRVYAFQSFSLMDARSADDDWSQHWVSWEDGWGTVTGRDKRWGAFANIGRTSGSFRMRCQHIDPQMWTILQRPEIEGTTVYRRFPGILSSPGSTSRPLARVARKPHAAPEGLASHPCRPSNLRDIHPMIRRNIRGGHRKRRRRFRYRSAPCKCSCSFPCPLLGWTVPSRTTPSAGLAAFGETHRDTGPRHCWLACVCRSWVGCTKQPASPVSLTTPADLLSTCRPPCAVCCAARAPPR
jgi:hypothetical protein